MNCQICGKELTNDEKWDADASRSFNICCHKHSKYRYKFQRDYIKETLKLKEEEDKKCAVCGKKLTKRMIRFCYAINSFSWLCKAHIEYHVYHMIKKCTVCGKVLNLNDQKLPDIYKCKEHQK